MKIQRIIVGMLIIAVMISMRAFTQTRLRQLPDTEILRRGNFVIGATIDGYLCYGTHEPLETFCHKAVSKPWSE